MRLERDYDAVIRIAEGEIVTHELNWLGWLGHDTIQAAFIEATGLTVTPLGNSITTQSFRIENAVAGERYEMVATITTAGGDTLKASLLVIGERP